MTGTSITIPVDPTNPGQFFACCGLFELTDRLWPGAESWFEGASFGMHTHGGSLKAMWAALRTSSVSNTMTPEQQARLAELTRMSRKQRVAEPGLDDEKKALESLRREAPIVISGDLAIVVDWFTDDRSGGSRFKTWAGQQSVLDIATSMHGGLEATAAGELWGSARRIGLPFNFDSDLGSVGSALDVGFSFDALAESTSTRIEGTCRPGLEFLCFLGLQRFRPRGITRQNRFVYSAWSTSLPLSVAAAVACGAVDCGDRSRFEFRLLYRTKYLKSFLPAVPYQGDGDE